PVDFVALEQARKVKNAQGDVLPAGVPFSGAELAALFAVCDADRRPAGRRDSALFAVLRQTGARRFEVAGLDMADYEPGAGGLRFRLLKRGRQKASALAKDAQALVNEWLAIRGDAPGALLCPVDRVGRIRIGRLSGTAIRDIIIRRCAEAGIAQHKPHD